MTDNPAVSVGNQEPKPFLSELSTTTGPVTGVIQDGIGGQSTPLTGVLARSAVTPSNWLSFVYGLLAGMVTCALVLSIVIEWRRQHPVQIVYAGALMAILVTLTYVHLSLVGEVLIV